MFYDKSGDYTVTPKCLFVIFENAMVKIEGQWHWSRQISFSIDQWLSYSLPMSLPHLIYSAYPNWDGYARLQVFLISWVEEMLDVILDFKDHC